MLGVNGNRRQLLHLFFALVDSLLILLGVLVGILVRFRGDTAFVQNTDYLGLKMMIIVVVAQVAFYYFDLYDLNTCRGKKKMGALLFESLLVSSLFLGVIYYLVPFLETGRGVFSISFMFILLTTFAWRVIYVKWSRTKALKERVLIVGTGELAMKIKREIQEHGDDGFEIVGYIDETREKYRTRNQTDHSRT
jgi:FlaA1/EpsC-like NDP-sugar epimerase